MYLHSRNLSTGNIGYFSLQMHNWCLWVSGMDDYYGISIVSVCKWLNFLTTNYVTNRLHEAESSWDSNRNSPHFMESKVSLPHSQKPATSPYPDPYRFSPCTHPISLRSILILSSLIRLVLPSGLFSSSFRTKPCIRISCSPYVLHDLSTSVFLIWSPEWYLVRSIENKAPCYVVFSTPQLPRPSQAPTSFSAPYSRKHLAYIFYQ